MLLAFWLSAVANGASADPPSQLQEWLADLQSPQRAVRVVAEQNLQSLPPSADVALQRELNAAPPPVQTQGRAILEVIRRRAADAAEQGASITLPHGATRDDVIAALSQNGQVQIEWPVELSRELPLPEPQPASLLFWRGVDLLAEQGPATWTWSSSRQLKFAATLQPHASDAFVSGPFRVQAGTCEQRTLPAATPRAPVAQLLRIPLRLDAEPQLHPYRVRWSNESLFVSVNADPDPLPMTGAVREQRFFDQTANWNVDVPLPAGDAPSTAAVTGHLEVLCARQRVPLLMPINAIPAVRGAGEMTAELTGWTMTDDQAQAELNVSYAPPITWESHQLGWLHRDIRCRLSDGVEVASVSREVIATTSGGHRVRCEFERPADVDVTSWRSPIEVIYVASAYLRELSCPVQFNDLPIAGAASRPDP